MTTSKLNNTEKTPKRCNPAAFVKVLFAGLLLALSTTSCALLGSGTSIIPAEYTETNPVLSPEFAKRDARQLCDEKRGVGCLRLGWLGGGSKYFELACSLGEAAGCLHVAYKLSAGDKQMHYLDRGCQLGLSAACEFRKRVESGASMQEIEKEGIRIAPEVRDLLGSLQDKAKACYEARLNELAILNLSEREKNPEGNVMTRFLVASTGEVLWTEVKSTSLNQPKVENCLLRLLAGLRFAPTQAMGTANVSYPWNFLVQDSVRQQAFEEKGNGL